MNSKHKLKIIDFYFITDSKLTKKDIFEDAKSAIKAGVKIIQYREKDKSTKEMVKEATILKKICKDNALFLVNDRIDVAMAVNADGVHLGKDDMPYDIARLLLGNNKIIGLTVHNIKEAIQAKNIGADYVGASPIFKTKTKLDAGIPAGLSLIKKIKQKKDIPVIGIGGINLNNVTSVIQAGADSAVAISAVVTKDNVEKECRSFIKKIKLGLVR
ncbi:MAG: thiamine phosphate synthase [Nanoarchaeota archaeon]